MRIKVNIPAFFAFLCILVIAAYLRVVSIDSVPGWYSDEGTYINVAANLLKGRIEYFGVQGSFLFPARMPLFVWLLALVFHFFGVDINVLRFLTGSIGIINTALIYWILQKKSQPLALICALVFAIFPKAVLFSRLGFSYNLLAMLALILFWFCNQYLDTGKRRFAVAGALTLSLCLLSELVAVAFVPVFIIVILWKRWKDLWFALPLALFPPVLYTVVMVWLYPQAYWPDLQYSLFRVSSAILPIQFALILINSAVIHQDLWMLMGAIGVFLFPLPGFNKRLILFLFLPLMVLTRTIMVGFLSWYYLVPIFPFYAIGVGALIFIFSKAILAVSQQGFDQLLSRFPFRIPQSVVRFLLPANNLIFIVLLVIAPFAYFLFLTDTQIKEKNYTTGLEPILADVSEARAVVNYVNTNSDPDDLILASPSIAWALNANATDYHIALTYSGLSSKYFPKDVSHDRFRFNPTYQNAKFIIIDNLWLNWGEGNLKDLATIRYFAEKYPVAFQTKQITVYRIGDSQ